MTGRKLRNWLETEETGWDWGTVWELRNWVQTEELGYKRRTGLELRNREVGMGNWIELRI